MKSYLMTNNVNSMILTVTPESILMHNFQEIHLKDSQVLADSGEVMTGPFIFIPRETKKLIPRSCLRRSLVWVGLEDEEETEVLGKDLICKCMFG